MNRTWSALRHGLAIAVLAMPARPAIAAPAPTAATFAAIRSVDLALARIGWRLAVANAPLCDRLEPGLGLLLHAPSQYAPAARAAARRAFRFDGPLGVEGVIAGSPAAAAGIREDDAVLAIGSVRFAPDDPQAAASSAALATAHARIAALPADRPLEIDGRRDGVGYRRSVVPVPACRTRFEITVDSGFPAIADGELVQIGNRFLEDYPEDQAAAVIAHELAHNILRHRARLEAQGASFGILSGIGRTARLFRRTELEADALSVALLANASYDPAAAIRFWRSFGPTRGGLLRDRTHPPWRERVTVLTRAIAALGPARLVRPALVDTRERPLEGD